MQFTRSVVAAMLSAWYLWNHAVATSSDLSPEAKISAVNHQNGTAKYATEVAKGEGLPTIESLSIAANIKP